MRVVVTGGSGFTGRHVVRQALASGLDVVATARSAASAAVLAGLGAHVVTADLDDGASLAAAFSGAEGLLNVASLGFGHAPAVVAAAEGAGVRRAVFVSTTAVTTSLSAPSKRVRLAAEETIKSSSLEWTIVRPTMIYGEPGDRNIARLIALLRRAPLVPLPGGGRRLQQPVHVSDLAQAIVAALTAPAAIGQTYDLAGPEPLTFRELVTAAGQALGREPKLVSVPLRPAIAMIRMYERLVSNPRIKSEQLERLAEDKAFDIGAAVRDLGFRPRSFPDGIAAEVQALSG